MLSSTFDSQGKNLSFDEPANLQSSPDVQNKNPKPVKFEEDHGKFKTHGCNEKLRRN